MILSLFDWHCDTVHELYTQSCSLTDNALAVSLKRASVFRHYLQVMALWCPQGLSNEAGWNHILTALNRFRKDPALLQNRAQILTACPHVPPSRPTFFLSLEDARVLDGKPERIDLLYHAGIRIITPMWRGCTCMGGAHDTSCGFTAFGKRAMLHAMSLGILPDLSHASERAAEEMFEMADCVGIPVIASHSNASACCPVSRNLNDRQIQGILACGGIIGLNLHAPFLRAEGDAGIEDVLRHITHFAELGAMDALCFGCDMDGGVPPRELSNLSALTKIADALLQKNVSEAQVKALFFENAYRFAKQYLIS